MNEEISEKLRVLYVALTRAKEKIIIVNPINDREVNSFPTKNGVVNILERQKYKSFEDILLSIKEVLLKYIVNKEINVTKDYLKIEKPNYKTSLKTNDKKFKTSILNIEKKLINRQTYSHQAYLIKSEEDIIMNIGTKVHEVLEYLDFNNNDIDKYELDETLKNKIKKFLEQDFISPNNKYYKEFEFYDNESKGIIDLLIETENEFIVVDYKLKSIEPSYYEEQVRLYMNYIKKITNKQVKGYLYSIIDNIKKEIKI